MGIVPEYTRKAQKRYEEKCKRLILTFSPYDMDLYDYLQTKEPKATYIKGLIRQDMEREKEQEK